MTLTPSRNAFWDLVDAATRCVNLREPESAEALANAALEYAKARGYVKVEHNPHKQPNTLPYRYTDARTKAPDGATLYYVFIGPGHNSPAESYKVCARCMTRLDLQPHDCPHIHKETTT